MTIDTEKLRALLADAAEMGLKLPVESIGIAVRDIERRELCCLYDEPWGALIAAAVNALPELLDALATAEADRLTLARALDAPCGFRERLVAFWGDHFTVKARNRPEVVLPEALVSDAIRPHLAGNFADLLIAAVLHPAMLVYLDQVASVGPGSICC